MEQRLVAKAIQVLDTPQLRDHIWAREFLAMAHHRLGHRDQAREWLARSAAGYSSSVRAWAEDGAVGTRAFTT